MRFAFLFVCLIALTVLVGLGYLDIQRQLSAKLLPSAFDPTKLQEQIAALDARIVEIGGRPIPEPPVAFDPTELQAQVAALDARVAEIGERRPPPPFDPTELQEQIAALEGETAEIGSRPVPEPPPAFNPAGLQAQIAALEAKIGKTKYSEPAELIHLGVIYFEINDYTLTNDERAELNEIFSDPKYHSKNIIVIGFADRTGSDFYNIQISLLRAAEVKREIDAITGGKAVFVSIDGLGEIGIPVQTPDNRRERENRSVYIYEVKF